MIYMDNAATSWPKPKTVRTAINEALDHAGNPGRGTHSYTVWSSMKLNEVRQKLAKLFCIKNSQQSLLWADRHYCDGAQLRASSGRHARILSCK